MSRSLLILAALALVVLVFSPKPTVVEPVAGPPGPRDRISPSTLVSWIITGDRHTHVLDVRPSTRFMETGIRTAESMPADSIDEATVRSIPSGHFVVVYGETEDDAQEAFRLIRALHPQTYILTGGFERWESDILEAGDPPSDNDEDAWEDYRTHVALVRYLTGQTESAPVPERRNVRPVMRPRIKVKNEGC